MTEFTIELSTQVGVISFSWNQSGLLAQIQWKAYASYEDFQEHQKKFRLQKFKMKSSELDFAQSGNFKSLLDSFPKYFETGDPLPSLSWDRLETGGLTEFQQKVYRVLQEIPHAETRTYQWVAERVAQKLGSKPACRAVGQALSNNPFPFLVPCHRVVSKTALGGFMGSTDLTHPPLRLKKWLIEVEHQYRNPVFSFLPSLFEPSVIFAGASL